MIIKIGFINNMKKEIKTILFASLIVALVLPFSAMNIADANVGEDTRTKTIKKVQEKIKDIESKKAKNDQDKLDLKRLKLADKFLKAKQDNDIEKIEKYSKTIQDLKPKDYKEKLIPATSGNIAEQTTLSVSSNDMVIGLSSNYGETVPMAHYSYETWNGTTEYVWDCRDDSDLTGYGDGSITGYTSSIYGVSTFHYPPERTVGPQGLNCEERDYEDGKTLYYQFLSSSTGCYSGNHSTKTSTTGYSCTVLSIGDLIEIEVSIDYDPNLDFSPFPSHDILWVGN